jgi:ACS family glucarate transporter-like MFS transporter
MSTSTRIETIPAVGRFRWAIVRVLVVVAIFLYVDRINITIAAPSVSAEFHLTPAELGRILSAFLFGYAAGLVPGGYLADRLGPHRLITGAGALWGIVTILTGCLPAQSGARNTLALDALIAARFALGACEACAFPTFNRALANWMLKSERARASGWVHCGAGLGGALTPLLIASLIQRFGWRISFIASGVMTLAISAWWWRVATDDPSGHPKVTAAEAEAVRRERDSGKIEPLNWGWFLRAARSPDAQLLCASMFCFGVAQFVYITWFYTYFMKARGASAMDAAALATLPYLGIAIGSPLGGALCDWSARRFGAPWGRRAVPLGALLLAGLSAVIAPAIASNALAATLFALAAGLQYSSAAAYWSTAIDLTRQGTGILGGFMNGSNYLGSALATVMFPFFVREAGWTRAIQSVSVAAVLASALWLGINSSRRIDAS